MISPSKERHAMSRSFRSLLGTIAIALAALFSVVAAGQYLYLRYQLHAKTKNDLWNLAEDLRDQIAFAETWDLHGYRRTTEGPDTYLVMSANGTLIDTHGYFKGMLSRVSVPFPLDFDHRVRFESEVGEEWNLYSHRLSDGLVILGVRSEIAPDGLDALFASNAGRFGTTVHGALRKPERAIDESFDYAIIDKAGTLRWAIGGIPLKGIAPAIPPEPTFARVRRIAGNLYAAVFDPVLSKAGRSVGLISVFEDVTDEQRVLGGSARFNILIAVMLWLATVSLITLYLRQSRTTEISCRQILTLDECETIEFKSSLRWDYANSKMNRDLEKQVTKAVAGFLNSERGGTLVIGMNDRKEVLGLENDYRTFKSVKPDRDGFELTLRGILAKSVGERCCVKCVKVRFCTVREKELCLVTVTPAGYPVYLDEEGGRPAFYLRIGNATKPLNVKEAVAYSGERWTSLRNYRPSRRSPMGLGA